MVSPVLPPAFGNRSSLDLWTKTDGHGEMWPLLTGQKLYLVCHWQTFLGARVPACHIRAGPCRRCFGCTTGWVWKRGFCCAQLDVTLSALPEQRLGSQKKGSLGVPLFMLRWGLYPGPPWYPHLKRTLLLTGHIIWTTSLSILLSYCGTPRFLCFSEFWVSKGSSSIS